jgi:GNAT superfamily N-acetyltransferase
VIAQSDIRPGSTLVTVRSATNVDNESLLTLVRRCPMKADISLIVERDPDFFALSRARGEAHTFVAEVDDAIVGCLSSWRYTAWLGGRHKSICYVGDLRVAPEYRRCGVGWQLGKTNLDYLNTLPAAPFMAATGAGNKAVAPLAAAFGAGGVPFARFTSWQLLPIVPLRISSTFDIGAAEQRDVSDLVTLLDNFHRSRNFSPIFSDGGLHSLVARSQGMQLSDYLVARRSGRIVAALGVWDASSIKRTRVAGMPLWLRGLCAVGRGASRIVPITPFPQPGSLVHFRYIRHAAFENGESDALQTLVHYAVNAARARGEHFLLYTCANNDALCSAVKGVPRLSFHYGITSSNFRPDTLAVDQHATPHSGYFDDAALA